jgi:hypothetical protein
MSAEIQAEDIKAHYASIASPSQIGGKTHRGFCPECGSPIQAKPDSTTHIVAIRTASLDDQRSAKSRSRPLSSN